MCSHAWILTCLDGHMLPYSHALIILCSHAHILWWSHTPMLIHINIHKFDIHPHKHALRWLFVYMLGGLNEHAIGNSCTQILWWLCLNAKVIGRYMVCVLRWFNTQMFVCSHTCMLSCSHVQLIVTPSKEFFTNCH